MYLSSGTILHNRYVIESILGHGGFGITYAAHDQTLKVRVAIKEYLPRQLATRGEGRTQVSVFTGEARQQYDYGLRKFLEEAQSVARFAHHPNVVSARDYFEANGTAYMVMEYVEGVTLKEYLEKKGGRISFEEARGIMMPVMDALREVHQAGMLHRDISPDNIYITTSAQVKILDFGAARYFAGEQSKSLSVILKPGYAPEEQYRSSGKQGSWTDVYAVGATIYKALTGKTPPDALDRMAEDTLVPPSRLGVAIPPAAEQALLQALAVNAGQRFQTMGEFQQALLGNAALTMGFQPAQAPSQPAPEPGYTPGAPPVSTPAQPPVYPPSAPPPSHYPQAPRRSANPAAIAAGIGAGVLGLALLVMLVWKLVDRPYQSPPVVNPPPVVVHPPVVPPTTPPQGETKDPPKGPVLPQVAPLAQDLSRFQAGRRWTIDWQSQFKYQGVMHIRQQLAANQYLSRITVTFINHKNRQITVSMDGRLTVNGKNVVINCSNASESWWDTDDFYLEWNNDTMTGYNIDKRGRRGNAVFRFVETPSSTAPTPSGENREQQIALSRTLFEQGRAYFKENKFPEAIEKLQSSIQLDPSRAAAHYILGWSFNQVDRNQEAVEQFKRAIVLKSDYALAYDGLSWTYNKLNRFPEAIAAGEQAVRLNYQFPDAQYNLGMAYLGAGNKQIALKQYHILKQMSKDKAEMLAGNMAKMEFPSKVGDQETQFYSRGINNNDVLKFIQTYLQLVSNNNLEEILNYYAPTVNYFDKGLVNSDFILKDKSDYFKRWPNRQYAIIDDIKIVDVSDELKLVDFNINFIVQNSKNTIKGTAVNQWEIKKINNQLKIVNEKQKVIQREKY